MADSNYIESFVNAFQSGEFLTEDEVGPICGRITCGIREEHFEKLGSSGWQPYSFVMDREGLSMLTSTKSIAEKFLTIGFTMQWIRKKLNDGFVFKLSIFPESEATPATWDGIFSLIQTTYPGLYEKCLKHRVALENTSFEEIQAQCPLENFSYFETGQDRERKSKPERYIRAEQLDAIEEPELWQTRAFLYYVFNLADLFDGKGRTVASDGTVGFREFLVPNVKLSDLSECRLIDIPISIEDCGL